MSLSEIHLIYCLNGSKHDFLPGLITAAIISKDSSVGKKLKVEQTVDTASSSAKEDVFYLNQNCASVCRLLVRSASKQSQEKLYGGENIVNKSLIDSWITFASNLLSDDRLAISLKELNAHLEKTKVVVGTSVSLADIFLWSYLTFAEINLSDYPNTVRWHNFVNDHLHSQKAFKYLPEGEKNKLEEKRKEMKKGGDQVKEKQSVSKEEAKYVDLPGAVMNEVVVRFPPEASGYLHIGHAKAALLNQHYQLAFKGKLVFRFDDTNPEKEKEDYEEVIREDVKMLRIKPDVCSYTSDFFDLCLKHCEELIKKGKAYVDDTPGEQMKQEREQRLESKNRNNGVDQNLQMWEEMKKGTELGQKCCVRAKIDMNSDNGCMRDPALYRCKAEKHPRTGDKYKAYPTYDFACPIVDSVEGVTHALRTTEYTDRDPQYYWVIDALGIRKPYIWAYSRLNMMNTVLSKRKLTWFVDSHVVDGWDDPRMPTVRGILRRGMTVDGLKDFITAQGSSRSVVFMEWDKIWSFNKKVIDPVAPRYMAVEESSAVPVTVLGAEEGSLDVNVHPKNQELGTRKVKVGSKLLVDQTDAALMKEGENVTFINWGNLLIKKIEKEPNTGVVTAITAEPNLDNKDFKKTLKVTWLEASATIKANVHYYEHIILKPVLGKDDDFKNFMNKESHKEVSFLLEEGGKDLTKCDVIQILRKGFFICDQPYDESSIRHLGVPKPIALISVPDGSTDLNVFPKEIQQWKKDLKEKMAKLSAESAPKASKVASAGASKADELNQKIMEQGNLIRDMKSAKKGKDEIQAEVAKLLDLKKQYKEATGVEWKPGEHKPAVVPNSQPATAASAGTSMVETAPKASEVSSAGASKADELNQKIIEQGNAVRDMKSAKKSKDEIQAEVAKLLELKKQYKDATSGEWKPGEHKSAVVPGSQPAAAASAGASKADELNQKIINQGNVVRDMKSAKKSKDEIQAEVAKLLELKKQYKDVTSVEWKPGEHKSTASPNTQPASATSPAGDASPTAQPAPKPTNAVNGVGGDAASLDQKVKQQGDKIRELKKQKKSKEELQPEIDLLLKLKEEYKSVAGQEWKPAEAFSAPTASNDSVKKSSSNPPAKKSGDAKPGNPKGKPKEESKTGLKKVTRLGLETKKSENFAEWYTEVITKAELIEYYDVSGCYILRPWSFAIWECIQSYFDKCIKGIGVKNCYFPMFVSSQALEREKTHIADFAPEVAWVTKSGSSDLSEPIAIRPTSETVMYPSFAKWVKSHRDLPIRINQWCNVVRWEFKNPTPFLRTREFLWQEGHTAHMLQEDAVKEVYKILDFYAEVYEKLLAVPVIKGRKTEKEKFAGGDFTTTIEAYVSENGRGVQAATSHHLGQNFSKMFEIIYEDPNQAGRHQYVYQNSWGLSSRSIGVMILVHSDDKGLVLPPYVAAIQVIIIPCGITANTSEADKEDLLEGCRKLEKVLVESGIRCESDLSEHNSPGWKYNHWELKGVPIRVELGPKELKESKIVAARRDTSVKSVLNVATVGDEMKTLLQSIQDSLFEKALKLRNERLVVTESWNEFLEKLEKKCIIMAPFCGGILCEDEIKKNSTKEDQTDASGPLMGAKSLCIPAEQPKKLAENSKCVNPGCSQKAPFYTLFGRSY